MRLSVIAIGLTLVLTAPSAGVRAGAPPPPDVSLQATEPDRTSRSWRRVSSNNFVAVGDASEAALRDALTELEVFRSAMFGLSSVLPAPRFNATTPLMVLFRNDSTFAPYKPRDSDGRRRNNVAGYYVRAPWGTYMLTAADGHRLGPQLSVVLHEYAHDVFHHTLGDHLPRWLDEGLAELCGSVGAAGNSQVIGRFLGRPLEYHVFRVRGAARPSVADLLTIDGTSLSAMNENDIGLFYSKSWALVHYLLLGREDRRPGDVPAFLSALESGRTPIDAFQQAFRVDATTIDAALAQYMQRVSLPAVRINDVTASLRTIATEQMLESEVDQLQGQLLLQMYDVSAAATRLTRALARNPESAATRVSLAEYRLADHRPLDAIELLTPVVASDPRNIVALITLGRAHQQAGRFRDALDAFTTATSLAASEATQVEAWYGRSLAALALGMTDDAEAAMTRVRSIARGPRWHSRRARDLWASGHDAFAIADAEIMVASPDAGVTDRSYAAFVGALSARRINQPEVAAALLERSASPTDAPWTRTVRAYLGGDLSDRDFLSKARGRGEQTEANAYIGFTASLAGRLDDARRHLIWVRDRGSRSYTEYAMALAELARLDTAARPSN